MELEMTYSATISRQSEQNFRVLRRCLMSSAALATLAVVAAPERATAQSTQGAFLGNPTVVSGAATRQVTGSGTETITVGTNNAIINWTPIDTTSPIVNFLPAGHTATFQNGANVTNFAVLNRILPSAPGQIVALNGTVISQLQSEAGNVRGGTVAFYTPNGLVIGSTAVFDVGSLVLTTLDPANFGAFASGNFSRFTASNPSSSIVVQPGAQINALQPGSVVAMLSPRVEMGGNVV
jgi:filamentous hemagglutinin family protein